MIGLKIEKSNHLVWVFVSVCVCVRTGQVGEYDSEEPGKAKKIPWLFLTHHLSVFPIRGEQFPRECCVSSVRDHIS